MLRRWQAAAGNDGSTAPTAPRAPASTTIAGSVSVRGAATDAVLDALRIDATTASSALCYASGLDARGGAKASGVDLVVGGRPTPTSACGILSDGFDGGDLSPRSARRP